MAGKTCCHIVFDDRVHHGCKGLERLKVVTAQHSESVMAVRLIIDSQVTLCVSVLRACGC